MVAWTHPLGLWKANIYSIVISECIVLIRG